MRASAILAPLAMFWNPPDEGSAATICRLGRSRHVADLRFIVWLTVITFALAAGVAIPFEYWHLLSDNWKTEVAQSHSNWMWLRLLGDAVVGGSPFIGAAFALACGIIGWAYQAGSARLGIVDLFACEICTLCRVGTVSDITRRYIQAFQADLPSGGAAPDVIKRLHAGFRTLQVDENYTPVFNQNARDLQVLDVKVVTNVTAFHTYMKAMRDALRNLGKTAESEQTPDAHDSWHEALASVLYMQFLALESARKAVRDLIEFEPNEVENTITILVSELVAYKFLLGHFGPGDGGPPEGDYRHARLALRKDQYKPLVAWTYWRAKEGAPYWAARETAAREELARLESLPGWLPRSAEARRQRNKVYAIADVAREWGRAGETALELRRRFNELFPNETIERPAELLKPDANSPLA